MKKLDKSVWGHSLRFFILDFKQAQMIIKRDGNSKISKDVKFIPFRNIQGCGPGVTVNNQNNIGGLKEFKYSLVLDTNEHQYQIFCQKEFDRNLWLYAFKYVIILNEQVQNIFRKTLL